MTDGYQADERLYHDGQGRWVSPDPAGLGAVDLANPQSLNRYVYVMNDPLDNVDPSGLDANTGTICYTTSGVGQQGIIFQVTTTCAVYAASSPPPNTVGGQVIYAQAGYTGGGEGTQSSVVPCFVKGLKGGVAGAVVVAAATTVAAAFLAPEVVTGALLVGAAYGVAKITVSVANNVQNRNKAGLAYNAGSVIGGLIGGGVTGFGVRYSITGETNLPTGLGNFFGKGKGIDLSRPGQSYFEAIRAAFSKGPDLGGAGLAVGVAGAATTAGCK